jgi:hypothetical protein
VAISSPVIGQTDVRQRLRTVVDHDRRKPLTDGTVHESAGIVAGGEQQQTVDGAGASLRRQTFSFWASSVTSVDMSTYPDADAACCAPAIKLHTRGC